MERVEAMAHRVQVVQVGPHLLVELVVQVVQQELVVQQVRRERRERQV